jgi:tetratricopeptide (TPR) repeat protein
VPTLERTEKVAEILPGDAQAQLNYGKALHEVGRHQEAIERYELALKRNPELAEAEFYLALAWYDLKDFDKSIEHHQRALQLDPKKGEWEFRLARVLVAKGLSKEARLRFEHSLSLSPNQPLAPLAHKEFADLLCGLGEYDAAISHYETALRLEPEYAQAQQNLAFTRTLAGH